MGEILPFLALKMMVKSGLEKIFLKFSYNSFCLIEMSTSVQNCKFSNKNDLLSAWRDFPFFLWCIFMSKLKL